MKASSPRDKITGPVGGVAPNDAEHFICCAACGAVIDVRELGQVLAHCGPLPHPSPGQGKSGK